MEAARWAEHGNIQKKQTDPNYIQIINLILKNIPL